jgi:signal transduction histidine kinase
MKKVKQNWLVALVHAFIGGLVFPLVLLAILVWVLALIGGQSVSDLDQNTWFKFVAEVLQILAIWVGAGLSSTFILKRYIPSSFKQVLNLSTIFLAIALSIAFATAVIDGINILVVIIYTIGAPLSCVVFYYESKKMLILNHGEESETKSK